MEFPYVNIHTHRPTGRGVELRTAGVHPWDAERQAVAPLTALLDGAQHIAPPLPDRIQAIGETGLDFACGTARTAQYAVFRAQLRLAHEKRMPVVLHCVRAFEEVMRALAACEPRAVIFHGFVGSPEQARQALAKGYFLSFGERTFASPKTLAALRATPLRQLFLETDDSAATIESIYARAADATGRTVGELQQATLDNYNRIFTDNGACSPAPQSGVQADDAQRTT